MMHRLAAGLAVVALSLAQAGPCLAQKTAGTVAAEDLAKAPDLSPAMRAIFNADQADRSTESIDWKVVMAADEARWKETLRLLEAGALRSAADDEAAAFVFQHGSQSTSFLLAHTMAMAAMAKGRKQAAWIAAASLDRYLGTTQHPQIYGTQFSRPGEVWTQEPYDRALIPESLLVELGVPGSTEQIARLKAMNAAKP